VASDPVLFTHPSSLEHETGAHPERAARLVAIDDALTARGHLGWALRSSPLAEDDLLTAVHPASHVEAIRGLSERGGGWIDA
jgi:acetoin utilization deacetylase AcuC-like enzyme